MTYFCGWNVNLMSFMEEGIKKRIPIILVGEDFGGMKEGLYVEKNIYIMECVKVVELGVFFFKYIIYIFFHFPFKMIIYYYKMWVQFTSPYSLNQWIHCIPIRSCSLFTQNLVKSLGI